MGASSEVASVRIVRLRTPPPHRLTPAHVFDSFGWCASGELEWLRPESRWDTSTPIDGTNPERMVFVIRPPCDFLPWEAARLHAFGLGLEDDARALAPWAIDEATDQLFLRRCPPASVLSLAADNVNALFWGLHDWVHFHNHGPFDERAWTELQCDTTALAWLWLNREAIPLTVEQWHHARAQIERLSRERFAAEAAPFEPGWMAPETLIHLASG
jgi:hypothetical protein